MLHRILLSIWLFRVLSINSTLHINMGVFEDKFLTEYHSWIKIWYDSVDDMWNEECVLVDRQPASIIKFQGNRYRFRNGKFVAETDPTDIISFTENQFKSKYEAKEIIVVGNVYTDLSDYEYGTYIEPIKAYEKPLLEFTIQGHESRELPATQLFTPDNAQFMFFFLDNDVHSTFKWNMVFSLHKVEEDKNPNNVKIHFIHDSKPEPLYLEYSLGSVIYHAVNNQIQIRTREHWIDPIRNHYHNLHLAAYIKQRRNILTAYLHNYHSFKSESGNGECGPRAINNVLNGEYVTNVIMAKAFVPSSKQLKQIKLPSKKVKISAPEIAEIKSINKKNRIAYKTANGGRRYQVMALYNTLEDYRTDLPSDYTAFSNHAIEHVLKTLNTQIGWLHPKDFEKTGTSVQELTKKLLGLRVKHERPLLGLIFNYHHKETERHWVGIRHSDYWHTTIPEPYHWIWIQSISRYEQLYFTDEELAEWLIEIGSENFEKHCLIVGKKRVGERYLTVIPQAPWEHAPENKAIQYWKCIVSKQEHGEELFYVDDMVRNCKKIVDATFSGSTSHVNMLIYHEMQNVIGLMENEKIEEEQNIYKQIMSHDKSLLKRERIKKWRNNKHKV